MGWRCSRYNSGCDDCELYDHWHCRLTGGNERSVSSLAEDAGPAHNGASGASVSRAEWQAAVDALKKTEASWPLVGVDAEVFEGPCLWRDDRDRLGLVVRILAIFKNRLDQVICSVEREGGECFCVIPECLRPVRTPEQIAAEERERDACELYCTINWQGGVPEWKNQTVDRKNDYFKAIDAGYRKQEPK